MDAAKGGAGSAGRLEAAAGPPLAAGVQGFAAGCRVSRPFLRWRQLRPAANGKQQVRRRPLRGRLERPLQRLAVRRHYVAEHVRPVLRQAQQRPLQTRRFHLSEQPRGRFVPRNAVLKRQELPQPLLPLAPESSMSTQARPPASTVSSATPSVSSSTY